MANILNVFPLSIYRGTVALDPAARSRMIEAVLEMGRTQPRKVTGATWTGDINGFAFLHQDPRFDELFAGFSDHLRRYLDHLDIDRDKLCLYYTRSWATISQGKEFIAPHKHRQSHLSLVYYLKKPAGSGAISFSNSDAPNQFAPYLFREEAVQHGIIKEPTIFNTQAVNVDAGEGDVLIFPSTTTHSTAPNLSEQPRLSIAVDIVTTVRDSQLLEFLLPDLDKWTLAS